MLDFGDYCTIEQKRYGVDNEMYKYKVIGSARTNYYHPVPVQTGGEKMVRGDMCDVVKVIQCGICEETVETFRLEDVKENYTGTF